MEQIDSTDLNSINNCPNTNFSMINSSSYLNHVKSLNNHQMDQSTKIKAQIYSSSSSSSSSSTSSTASSSAHLQQNKLNLSKISSSTNSSNTTKYIFILNAFVNGFVQLKLCADKIDYEFIIEIYWSNDSRSFVKRTYEDFVKFHYNLNCHFSQFFSELLSKNNKSLSTSFLSNRSKDSNNNSNNNNKNFFNFKTSNTSNNNKSIHNIDEQNSMPLLPASKKRFWISNLKLAELREIELNSYVQRILKLPIKIAHSQIVLQFFESQSSDPKPSRIGLSRTINNPNNVECTDFGSDSLEEDRNSDDFIENEDDEIQNSSNEANDSNCSNNFDRDGEEEEEEEPEAYGNDSEDEEENNTENLNGLNNSNKKKTNKEACLWWDEDNALNELTSSTTFEFGSQYHLNQHQYGSSNGYGHNADANEEDDDIETLKTLESILKTSDLFGNASPNEIKPSNDNNFVTSFSSVNSFKYRNKEDLGHNLNSNKRLSLS